MTPLSPSRARGRPIGIESAVFECAPRTVDASGVEWLLFVEPTDSGVVLVLRNGRRELARRLPIRALYESYGTAREAVAAATESMLGEINAEIAKRSNQWRPGL